jgi:hypothetical protein
VIGREEQIFEEKETINTTLDLTEETTAIDIKKLETNDNENQDTNVKSSQLPVPLFPDDSWMSILEELLTIDSDDISHKEENTINEQ